MQELFLVICAMTALNCSDVNVYYHGLSFDTHAIAAIDIHGDYHIVTDPNMRRESVPFKTRLLVHEIAYLLVYEIDPTNATHNEVFDDICEELSIRVGVRPSKTCAAYSGTPSYWNTTAHYRRDR